VIREAVYLVAGTVGDWVDLFTRNEYSVKLKKD
jgi:hypothetical protein